MLAFQNITHGLIVYWFQQCQDFLIVDFFKTTFFQAFSFNVLIFNSLNFPHKLSFKVFSYLEFTIWGVVTVKGVKAIVNCSKKNAPYQILKIFKNDIYMRFYNCVCYLMKLQGSKFETISLWDFFIKTYIIIKCTTFILIKITTFELL